ncbi:Hypothetical_protein [Hexamita inflata]|uniref:Hypothetical_protein n=1 Tax=Hexamita inflata TaxID=28002 RepID=A0AA86UMV9_9EUKA|nr:Hypothetical protein HINF_LOCUS49169 [Hexamita inflata]
MNGKVSLSENFIANPYQITNQILFYKQYDCFVTDLDLNIVEQLPIHFVLKDDKQFTFTSNPDTILGKEYQHNHLTPCNGKLYVILNDVLFSVFLNIFTEIATIPEMTQMNSNCLCAFEDKLIATNYYKLFVLENNEFIEQSLCSEYSENVESIFLESFGSTAIIGLQIGYCSCLCQILSLDNYKLLYLGHRLDKWLLDGGLCVLNVDYNNSCMVLDLTQTERACPSQQAFMKHIERLILAILQNLSALRLCASFFQTSVHNLQNAKRKYLWTNSKGLQYQFRNRFTGGKQSLKFKYKSVL